MTVELHHGDCLDVMATIPDDSIHLVVTSPPYGDMFFGLDIGECRELIHGVIAESERVLVPGGKLAINVNNYITSRKAGWVKRQVIPMTMWVQESCRLTYQDEIFWCKGLAQAGRAKPLFGSYPYPPNFLMSQRIEYILVYGKDGNRSIDDKEPSRVSVDEWREWTQNLWNIMGSRRDVHPAPFPEELPHRLIKLYSFVDDTVLDPFMGTGTTGVVAVKNNRDFIGIELDESYYLGATERINSTQLRLL